jgi:hypothetical protein
MLKRNYIRLDAAKAAAPYVHPRMAPAEPRHPDPDFVPLAERIAELDREDAIEASEGKVVELKRLWFRSVSNHH